ncbi:unnamed protein product, partial [Larinioides sclopetarius]
MLGDNEWTEDDYDWQEKAAKANRDLFMDIFADISFVRDLEDNKYYVIKINPEPEIHWSEVGGTRWPRICKGTRDDSLNKVLLQHWPKTSGNVWRINILHPYNVINNISLLQF